MIQNFHDALERAAGAGDDRISSLSIGNPSTVSPDRMIRVREIIKRFCEHISPDVMVSDILESFDEE